MVATAVKLLQSPATGMQQQWPSGCAGAQWVQAAFSRGKSDGGRIYVILGRRCAALMNPHSQIPQTAGCRAAGWGWLGSRCCASRKSLSALRSTPESRSRPELGLGAKQAVHAAGEQLAAVLAGWLHNLRLPYFGTACVGRSCHQQDGSGVPAFSRRPPAVATSAHACACALPVASPWPASR